MASKVLLVDDVSMFIELERDYLQLSAVTVLTARDGDEALKVCRLQRPELVFMDLHMPVMNGADCCREIKRDHRLSTAVILITTEGKEEERQLCLQAGCDGFLTKPLDRHAFLDAARKLLPAIDRRDRRVNSRLNVKFRAFGLTLSGSASNLSQNGIYVAADVELEEGATVEIIFALPEPFSAIIQTRARVAWLNSSKSRKKPSLPPGFGLEFLSITEDEREHIGRFVDSLEQTSARV